MGLPIVSAFIDRCTGFQEGGPLTTIHKIYYYLSDYLTTDRIGKGRSPPAVLKIKVEVKSLKNSMTDTLLERTDNYLYKLNYKLLHNVF